MARILIISHTFPPAAGVGGRRWAKFAKYLKRRGHDVFVLAAENCFNERSDWTSDVAGINIEYLPFRYPRRVVGPVRNLIDKILYHLIIRLLSILDSGNYFDRSIFWKNQIQKRVSSYILEKQIETVIVTGAPFRLVYFVTALKSKFPRVRFISDFRDLWTADTEVSAFSHLSSKRLEKEKEFEKAAVNNSDLVFTVSEKMCSYFNSIGIKGNSVLIPNGYDPEDIDGIGRGTGTAPISGEVRFIFAGTVYHNLDYVLKPFFGAVARLKRERPDLYKVFSLDFFGKFPEEYKGHIKEHAIGDVVHVHGKIPYPLLLEKTRAAHYGVLLLNDLYNFSFSTKFCEYMALRKKMIVVSNKGETAEYVDANGLGFHLDATQPYNGLVTAIERAVANNFNIETNQHFDVSVFAIDRITIKLETYLSN